MADTVDTVSVTIRLPRDVWRTLKVEAARQDKSAAALIRDGLTASAARIRAKEGEHAAPAA